MIMISDYVGFYDKQLLKSDRLLETYFQQLPTDKQPIINTRE